ncbi:pentapeptide repeat-containing protein [Chlorobium sp. N1]|uniref:pentapeptide repeat-containing protein n=1 Tax=Chlorobium sp. N1 TaxID=2491138 RepID=UPI00103AB778|nr:pentapeptide repeat-containing protein [Chlorobium sp. N1]TCD48430.1 hypothetical protein E0L29_00630 [Chlorobium sp. N1]
MNRQQSRFRPSSIAVLLFLAATLAPGFSRQLSAADDAMLEKLREGRDAWNAMRKAPGAEHPDLSGADLKGRKLSAFDLGGADFTGADLSQSNLSGADLHGARLDSASIASTILSGADLRGASMHSADLDSAQLEGADCSGADMRRADMRRADCSGARFVGTDLREAHFREAGLSGADLGRADLRAAYFWRANLDRTDLSGATVSQSTVLDSGSYATAVWAGANGLIFEADVPPPAPAAESPDVRVAGGAPAARQATAAVAEQRPEKAPRKGILNLWQRTGPVEAPYDAFQYESLKKNVTKWNRMRRTDRSVQVDLREADLAGRNLFGADLRNADLRSAGLRLADLSEADLRGADLRGADLRGATLTEADLGGADLRGARLWRANMSRARLEGARVSGSTVLDSGKKATAEWAEKQGARYIED